MKKAIIADNKSVKVDQVAEQKYYFCACGLSHNQPFCDGSHKGTEFRSLSYIAQSDDARSLCQCKYSKNLPFCDGSHQQFGDEQVGTEGPAI